MKPKTRKILLWTAVILVIVYFSVSFSLGWVMKSGVNRVGPKITQTKVELGGAELSPILGRGTLTHFTVANPAGWSSRNAFSAGRVSLTLMPFSIFGDHIVIDEIAIDQPEFSYETKFFSSNLNDLLKNIDSFQAKAGGDTERASNGKPIRFEVKHFIITRGKVTLGVPGAGELPLPLPTIELHDLGTAQGGISSDQLAVAVMKSVTSEVVSATANAAGKIGSTTGAAAAEGVKKASDELKKFFQKGK